jgi:Zn-finger protein
MPVANPNNISIRRNAPLRYYYIKNYGPNVAADHIVYPCDEKKNICPFCFSTFHRNEYQNFRDHINDCTDETQPRCTTCWMPDDSQAHRLSLEHHWGSRQVLSYNNEGFEITDIDSSNGVFMVNMGLFYAEHGVNRMTLTIPDVIRMVVGDIDFIMSSAHGVQLIYILQQIGFLSNANQVGLIPCRPCNDATSAFSLLAPMDFFDTRGKFVPCVECEFTGGVSIDCALFLRHFHPLIMGEDKPALIMAEDLEETFVPSVKHYGILAGGVKIVPFDCGLTSHLQKKKRDKKKR